MVLNKRLDFELDTVVDEGLTTARAGVPLVVELFRQSGAAEVVNLRADARKKRIRGLPASEIVESLFSLWTGGGDHCEDLERLREDLGLQQALGFKIPGVQTARDFLDRFHAEGAAPLWQGPLASIPQESAPLEGLDAANRRLLAFAQERRPTPTATIDLDAKFYACDKRNALKGYEGKRGYQPTIAVWAETDLIVVDEFRDGNVPAGSGTLRLVQRVKASLPDGVERLRIRGDSAHYEHDALAWMHAEGIEFAVSTDMSEGLRKEILKVPESSWSKLSDETDAVREWAEVGYVPDTGDHQKSSEPYLRYLAIRVRKRQGALFADGSDRKHFCVCTNRAGDGAELIQWHRDRAGSVEHVHDVLANELAAGCFPSQLFGANAAWFRMNVMLHNLLAILRHQALPPELKNARPKRLRFLLFNTIGRFIRHAREQLLRIGSEAVRLLYEKSRLWIFARSPPHPHSGV